MKFKSRFILMTLLLLLPAVLIACGGDDDKKDDDKKDDDGGNQSSAVTLSETYTSTQNGVTVTVKHPSGWVASDDAGIVQLASSQAIMDKANDSAAPQLASGESLMVIVPMPAATLTGSTPADFLGLMTSETGAGAGTEVGEVTALTVNGKEGAKVSVTTDGVTTLNYVIPISDDWAIQVIAVAGDVNAFDATAASILETVTVEGASE